MGARKCKFCENPANSREHLVSDWILQKINIQDEIRLIRGKSPPHFFKNLQNMKARFVCKPCNEGWMSRLEEESKPTISALFHDLSIPLDASRQSAVARWAVKTAMVFETTAPPPLKSGGHFYSKDECEQLRVASTIPPRTIVWLGRFSSVGVWGSGTHVWYDGKVISEAATHGHVFTVIINYLAVQVLTIHVLPEDGTTSFTIPENNAPCDWSELTVPIWPSAGTVSWPPNRSFMLTEPFKLGLLVNRFKTGAKT